MQRVRAHHPQLTDAVLMTQEPLISLVSPVTREDRELTFAATDVLSWIGNKWVASIVFELRTGPLRHGVLMKRMFGVSQRVLTLTLRALERDGIVERTAFAISPPCVVYELTPLGKSLQLLLQSLDDWAAANILAIKAARTYFDERTQVENTEATTRRVHRIG